MSHWCAVDGVLVEPVGYLWAAFSPATGDTVVLNDESAAILEVLQEATADMPAICAKLARDSGLGVDVLTVSLQAAWPRLIEAGLIREMPASVALPK